MSTRILKILSILFLVSLLAAGVLAGIGCAKTFRKIGDYGPMDASAFARITTPEEEDYSEEEDTVCSVEYTNGDETFTVTYTFEEWEALGDSAAFSGYAYRETDGNHIVAFPHEATDGEIRSAVHDLYADEAGDIFSASLSLLILGASFGVILFFGKHFTLYEKCWFLGIMILATFFAVLMPEESCNGVNGILIMLLYLLDTFLNILCELLISKQSKWNFIVSVFVEITEILICVVLAYRFATMASTLLFWLPCDIISFINWNKKPDRENEELTRVRSLKGWQEILVVGWIVGWTFGIGYLLTRIDLGTELFGGNEVLENIVCYLDACASIFGICNGLAILFRFREQWICWFCTAILEGAINILSGQWILLPLKLGYMTNCTYGYLEWTKYIKKHPEVMEEKSFF